MTVWLVFRLSHDYDAHATVARVCGTKAAALAVARTLPSTPWFDHLAKAERGRVPIDQGARVLCEGRFDGWTIEAWEVDGDGPDGNTS